jgi:hypothetical protein
MLKLIPLLNCDKGAMAKRSPFLRLRGHFQLLNVSDF